MAMYEFKSEPLTDFSNSANQEKYLEALKKVKKDLGKVYPLIIGGKRIKSERTLDSMNPADHQERIGTIYQASIKEAQLAMDTALETFKTWSKVS